MMREILFRGKRIDNGEWVIGDLLSGKRYGQVSDVWIGTTVYNPGGQYEPPGWDVSEYDVDPATVGQYTGLKDKNGRRIFEGDILGGHYDEDNPEDLAIEVVIWHKNGWYTKSGDHLPDAMDEKECLPRTEVIGNIHDNPDLIGGADE